jgi:hypothetical protein
MSAHIYTGTNWLGTGYVTTITVDGKKYKGTGKTEAESLMAAQAAVQASR